MNQLKMSFFLAYVCATFAFGIPRSEARPAFIYEIFTQSFADSNGDGLGDLEGVRSKLDYLSSLGADAIWLTPIFKSPSYHGYDVSDYLSIKSEYGDLSSFRNLVSSAHARGIQVVLDLPVNHTSVLHPWFSDQNIYLWNPIPLWNPSQWFAKCNAYYYSSFSPCMPDLNWRNPEVLTRVQNIFAFWVHEGVDGFRLDAAKFLVKGDNGEANTPETHAIWKTITKYIKAIAPETYFVGEVWDSAKNIASYYGDGDELDAAFDFTVEDGLRSSLQSMTNSDFLAALRTKVEVDVSPSFAAPFAGNHDLDRLATVLGQDLKAQKLAALAVFSLPGTPTLYYGDEIGMPNGDLSQFPDDLAKRTPMDWSKVSDQLKDPESLLGSYQRLAWVRKNEPALTYGNLSGIQALGESGMSFLRTDLASGRSVLIILNFGQQVLASQKLALPVEDLKGVELLYGNAQASITLGNELLISGVPAKEGAIFFSPLQSVTSLASVNQTLGIPFAFLK